MWYSTFSLPCCPPHVPAGEGSVFALLKAAGWASGLWAGESGGGLSFASFFTVHVELTEEGQRHIREVAQQVFRCVPSSG